MTDDLVKRLLKEVESDRIDMMMLEAASRIEKLERRIKELVADVQTYRQSALGCLDELNVFKHRANVMNEALKEIEKYANRKLHTPNESGWEINQQ